MGKTLILNGSPRAPRSNSKAYAALFSDCSPWETVYENITKTNHQALCQRVGEFSDVLFVFPLYADGLPVTLMAFLKTLSENPPEKKPTVSVLVNCGFLEPEQNDTAVEMLHLFCRQNGYPVGSVLKIGSGEAILTTPFRFLVRRKIKKLALAMAKGAQETFSVTMPLSKSLFLKASTRYWIACGEKNGVTREQMDTMDIDGPV